MTRLRKTFVSSHGDFVLIMLRKLSFLFFSGVRFVCMYLYIYFISLVEV